jgi:ABC-type Fe3+/spermidine/putrescine transport system ATPase subunit
LVGKVEGKDLVSCEIGAVTCGVPSDVSLGSTVTLGIRHEWIELKSQVEPAPNTFPGEIESRTFLGDSVLYRVRIGAARLWAKTTSTDFSPGGRIGVVLRTDRWVVFA